MQSFPVISLRKWVYVQNGDRNNFTFKLSFGFFSLIKPSSFRWLFAIHVIVDGFVTIYHTIWIRVLTFNHFISNAEKLIEHCELMFPIFSTFSHF